MKDDNLHEQEQIWWKKSRKAIRNMIEEEYHGEMSPNLFTHLLRNPNKALPTNLWWQPKLRIFILYEQGTAARKNLFVQSTNPCSRYRTLNKSGN